MPKATPRAAAIPAALALILAAACSPSPGGGPVGGRGGAGGTGGSGGARTDARPDTRPPAADAGGTPGLDAAGPTDSGPAPDAQPPGVDSGPGPDAAAPDSAPDGPPGNTTGGPWARQLRVGLVEVSQSVFIKIGEGETVAAPAMRNAELIEGRAMMVRVHVRPDAGFTPRMLLGRLTISQMGGGADTALEETKMIAGASNPEQLETTFNFLVPAAAVKPDARLTAQIHETGAATGPEPATPPRFPATGAADLAVKAGRMVLDVTLVPAIGPGGTVDASPARRKKVEDHLFDVYPVQRVNVRWRQPLRFTARISASAGFQALTMARMQDNASPGTYYHLLLAKEDSTEGYLGIANLAGASMSDGARRNGITFVTGRVVDSLLDTISHEMGHNHGRNHAPGCNAAGVDMSFPYVPGPGIGVNGWSLSEMKLKTVRMHKDLMGYCNVTWVSDYTWKGFERRVRAVSAFSPPDTPTPPGAMAFIPPLEGRTRIGYQSPGEPVLWAEVPGRLATTPDGVPEERLLSDGRTKEIVINLE